MIVGNGVFCWDGVDLLLDVDVDCWVLDNEGHLLLDGVLLYLPDSELSDVGDFVWHLDLGGVVLPEFDDEWLIDGDSEEVLVPLGLREFLLDVVWLLLVFSHGNLFGSDEWHLLDHSVVNSLGDFVGHFEFFLIWDLVVDGVWYFLGDNIWDLVGDSVRYLSAGGVWDLELDLEWHLSLDGVWDFTGDFIWLKSLNLIGLFNI